MNLGSDWAFRFKKKNAEKKPTTTELRQKLSPELVEKARTTDPSAYLESRGYKVERQGRHISARDGKEEVYRVTEKSDGHYVSCTKNSSPIGDNISLVRQEENLGFKEAVEKITGEFAPKKEVENVLPVVEKREPPRIPPQTEENRKEGREYLIKERGISSSVVENAEKSGFLEYSKNGVLFCGRDSFGQVQNCTRRDTKPDAEVPKRDLRGSDKGFAPILPGNEKTVWIVEGGTDALAVQSLAEKKGQKPPTVVVSGGARNKSFLDYPRVKDVLKKAEKVVVAHENEKNVDVQKQTEEGHKQQAEKIATIVPSAKIVFWTPPNGVKDVADLNKNIKKEEEKEGPRLSISL